MKFVGMATLAGWSLHTSLAKRTKRPSTSAQGWGATAIWKSNVVGAMISTSSSAPTCRFIRLTLFADPCWVPW